MIDIMYAESGNEGKDMRTTGGPRGNYGYPDRIPADRPRLTCGRCEGHGRTGFRHSWHGPECAWCSGRGWNYAAPMMGDDQ